MHEGRHGGKSSAVQNQNTDTRWQQFDDPLQAQLTDSGYCREGFVELDQTVESGLLSVRGLCKDKATAADRLHFRKLDD